MKKTSTNQKADLIRRYHTLCSKLGLSDEQKREMLWNNYQVISSKDLYVDQLESICRALNSRSNAEYTIKDTARKRVIAVLFDLLSLNGYKKDIEYVKRIACHAAKVKQFNDISLDKLEELYRKFGKKRTSKVDKWVDDILNNIPINV